MAASKELKEGNSDLKKMIELVGKLEKSYTSLNTTVDKGLNAIEEQAKKTTAAQKKRNTTTEDGRKKIDEETKQAKTLIKAQRDLELSYKNNAIEILKVKKVKQDMVKIQKLEIARGEGAAKTYEQLSAAYRLSAKKAKDLAVRYGVNSKKAREAAKSASEYNDELKEIDATMGQHQRNVGNYSEALDSMPGALGGAVNGFKGLIASAKAFIATPIGAVLAAIAGAGMLFKKAINRSEKATESFNKVGAFFKGILNGMLEGLTPVVEWLGDFFVKAIESPKEALKDLGNIIQNNIINRFKAFGVFGKSISELFKGNFKDAAKLAGEATLQLTTGITNGTEKLKQFGKTILETQKATIATANAEREYAKSQIELEKIQLRLQNEAEKLRQIRDDEAISIEERIKANEELGDVLNKQLQLELKLGKENLSRAIALQKANGQTIESIEAIGEAEIKLLEIEERITGQRSEQLVNTNSLLKERDDLLKESAEKQKALSDESYNNELELLDKQQELLLLTEKNAGKSQEEITRITIQAQIDRYKKQLELAEIYGKEISETEKDIISEKIKALEKDLEDSSKESIWEKIGFSDEDGAKAVSAVQQTYSKIMETLSTFADQRKELAEASVERADSEVDASEQNLNRQIQLAEMGYASNIVEAQRQLELDKQTKRKALAEQQEALKQQQRLETVQQSVGLITASVNVLKTFSTIPVVGWALGIAAVGSMIAAFVGQKAKAKKATKFAHGGYEEIGGGTHASGNDTTVGYNNDSELKAERGESIGIFTGKARKKYKSIIPNFVNDANKGKLEDRYSKAFSVGALPITVENNSNYDSSELKSINKTLKRIEKQGGEARHTDRNGNLVIKKGNVTRRIKTR